MILDEIVAVKRKQLELERGKKTLNDLIKKLRARKVRILRLLLRKKEYQ